MDSDSPWLYVAMIVIAFISWILNRIQEFTNDRKEARMRKLHPEQSRQVRQREEQSAETWLPDEAISPPGPSAPSPARSDLPDAFRDLLEALGGQPETPAPSRQPQPQARPQPQPLAPPRTSPPPIRRQQQTAVTITPASKPVAIAHAHPAASAPPKAFPSKEPSDTEAGLARQLLRSRSGIRQAMIVKEILGDPKGLW